MTLEDLRLVIMTRVADWGDAPLAFDNLPTPPAVASAQKSGDPWVFVTINDGDGVLRNFDNDVARTGLVILQVFAGRNKGERPARVVASSLCDHLEHYRSGGLVMRQANPSRAGDNKGHFQLNINIPFIAD